MGRYIRPIFFAKLFGFNKIKAYICCANYNQCVINSYKKEK